MAITMRKLLALAGMGLLAGACGPGGDGGGDPLTGGFFPTTANGEWQSYTGDAKGTRYSPLDQIHADNFADLEVAWSFKTDNLGNRPEYKLEGTPIMVGGKLFTTAGTRRAAVALDAKTGELIWMYSMREGARGGYAPRQLSGRGLTYWAD
ncbi:MAG TPA: hypothetical protein VLA43_05095, partial [Longimicrobiales bacterium]|nr:hypothetical protein [Longimicrobiales bacterium]